MRHRFVEPGHQPEGDGAVSPHARAWSWLAVSSLLLACARDGVAPLSARVECSGTAAATTIDCVVQHLAGDVPAQVCWELHYECRNTVRVVGTGLCSHVEPRGKSHRAVQLHELERVDHCDFPVSSEVRNVAVHEASALRTASAGPPPAAASL